MRLVDKISDVIKGEIQTRGEGEKNGLVDIEQLI